MIKYELMKDSIEISYKNRKEIRAGVVKTAHDRNPELIKAFNSKEEALAELKNFKSSVRKFSNGGMTFYYVEEYFIEINEYDDEEEWVNGGDVLEFSQLEIELVEKPSYERLAVFDNLEDAEKAYDEYDGENEVYLNL